MCPRKNCIADTKNTWDALLGASHDRFLPILSHGFPSQFWNSSRVMTSRSHFFFISLACSLQA